jgi:hypothetical protein
MEEYVDETPADLKVEMTVDMESEDYFGIDITRLARALAKNGKELPPTRDAALDLIKKAHERGHFGAKAVISQIMSCGWWWPEIHRDVSQHIRKCHPCLSYNVQHRGYHEARAANSRYPMDHLQIDFKTGLTPAPTGETVLLVVVDVFTGFVWLRPLKERTAEETVIALLGIFRDFGQPRILQGDSDRAFMGIVMNELLKAEQIEGRWTVPYTPEKHGLVENAIQKVMNVIWKQVVGVGNTWVQAAYHAQTYYNTMITETTRSTHFTLMFARPFPHGLPQSKAAFDGEEWKESLEAWEERMQRVFHLLYPAIADRKSAYQKRWIAKLNRDRKVLSEDYFPIGAVVYYEQKDKKRAQDPKFIGPWKIVHHLPAGDYLLMDFLGNIFPRPVPAQHLKLQYLSHTDMDDGEEHYEMEYIVDHKSNPFEFLIHWKGCGVEERSWEPHANIHGHEMLAEYWKKVNPSPEKPKKSKKKRTRKR